MANPDDKKIIFSMVGLNKTIRQNNKQVLKDIYLSFFYGAKIGIIGLNGSGKSTLMKIIAGLDNGAGGAENAIDGTSPRVGNAGHNTQEERQGQGDCQQATP